MSKEDKQNYLTIFLFFISFISTSAHAQEPYKLITNVKSFRELVAAQEKAIDRNIYDLSFPAYDAEFAEEFGLKPENVTALDVGLRFIELRMITEGQHTNCYYNVVLDKNVELAFPEENYIPATAQKVIPTFPVDLEKGIDSQKRLGELRSVFSSTPESTYWPNSKHYMNRTYIGNRDYRFNTSGKPFSNGHAFDVSLITYIFNRSQDYTIISTKRTCGGGDIYNHSKPSFWVRKKTPNIITNLPQKSDHHIFTIPDSIVKSFKPILFEYENHKRKQRNK